MGYFMGHFHIYAKELHWLDKSKDSPDDLCLHGTVVAVIGDEILEDICTASSTALYLLKSLTQNHIIDKQASQMLPCCGHFFVPNDDLTGVETIGCPNGTDWSVIHENGTVKIITENGAETIVDIDEYKKEAFAFADEVEAYYKKSQPKTFFDDYDEKGYTAFWNEFHRRRDV